MKSCEFVPFSKSDIEQSLPARFAYQVRRTPQSVAVRVGGQTYTYQQLDELTNRIAHAVIASRGGVLERQGLLVRDMDNSYLALEPRDEADLEQVLGSSITDRIAIGPQQGRKAFTLQTLPAQGNREENSSRVAGNPPWAIAGYARLCTEA